MHTAFAIGGGIVLLGLFLLFGYFWGAAGAAFGFAAKVFIPIWLVIALINMWVGVSKAGYPVREELPILLIVFLVPALIAAIVIWRETRRACP